ncbi:MAG TPA: guanylate kinase [Terriglobia bacterium]|nr:guanylate kinase [Terriglobia bacterium]
MRANVYIVSAPSGSGKTTLLQSLLKTFKDLKFSVSHTTRQPRQAEREGVDYFFTERSRFQEMADRGDFLEWAEYYGQLYGTSRAFVEEHVNAGRDVILDIDVNGARQVKQKIKDAIAVFIMPPSFGELERRLRSRRQESDEAIHRRLEIARSEIKYCRDYDHIIINDVLGDSIQVLEAVVRAGRARPWRQQARIDEIIASFGGTA